MVSTIRWFQSALEVEAKEQEWASSLALVSYSGLGLSVGAGGRRRCRWAWAWASARLVGAALELGVPASWASSDHVYRVDRCKQAATGSQTAYGG